MLLKHQQLSLSCYLLRGTLFTHNVIVLSMSDNICSSDFMWKIFFKNLSMLDKSFINGSVAHNLVRDVRFGFRHGAIMSLF